MGTKVNHNGPVQGHVQHLSPPDMNPAEGDAWAANLQKFVDELPPGKVKDDLNKTLADHAGKGWKGPEAAQFALDLGSANPNATPAITKTVAHQGQGL